MRGRAQSPDSKTSGAGHVDGFAHDEAAAVCVEGGQQRVSLRTKPTPHAGAS
jgi:hypothetical protein